MTDRERRRQVLLELGASADVAEALLAYNRYILEGPAQPLPAELPLPDEPFIEVWREYAAAAQQTGARAALRASLVQLSFPIREGISKPGAYRGATLKGTPPELIAEATLLGGALVLAALASFTLEELAAGDAPQRLAEVHVHLEQERRH